MKKKQLDEIRKEIEKLVVQRDTDRFGVVIWSILMFICGILFVLLVKIPFE